LLQATLDLNAQKSNLLVQQQLLQTYKNNLMVLLKSDLTSTFDVDTIFTFNEIKSIEELKQTVEKSNIDLSIAQKNVLISKQIENEIYALTMPKVGITSNYLFGRNQNAAGFSLLNQNLGYNLGFTFSWNVFNGFTTKKQLMSTQLQIKNDQLNVEKTKFTLYSAATIAYQIWMSNKEMLSLEEENIKLAERSMLITTERLKLGLGNYIEIKESQNSYEAAITRLVNARYNLKIAETTLKKLTGELVR
jgi:outer membrane protein TolC